MEKEEIKILIESNKEKYINYYIIAT